MAPGGDAPAVARRRVRLAVRAAREGQGLTQGQVAEAMEWSLSKVMRIENGEVTISPNDLRPLLAYLGIRDRAQVDDLVQAAKASKQRRQWWDEPRYRESLTLAMRHMIQYEAEFTLARYYCPFYVCGVLQTESYARSVLHGFEGSLTEQEIDVRVAARMRRRAQLLARDKAPTVLMLLDESLLYRQAGGRRALGEQLADLYKYTEQGWLSARVAPYTGPMPMLATYELLYLGEDDDSQAVLYRESDLLDEVVDDAAIIKRHRENWERHWANALSEEESARLISERVDELLLDSST
jgi:transcriptional regulator with XRE-family HTH domain